jgi:hypothetical protein
MTPQADPAHLLFIESRHAVRAPLTAGVRLGWINDLKKMEYLAAQGIDVSRSGLAVTTPQRLRVSALVHIAVADRGMVAIGRVRNCIRATTGWRTGIELTPMP